MQFYIVGRKGRADSLDFTPMKLNDLPINSIVELQFIYKYEKHKLRSVLPYKVSGAVYVSAIKDAGELIPVKKLKKFVLIYKTTAGVYVFKNLAPRSVSYNGQNLYAFPADTEAELVDHRNAYRLFIGAAVTAKVTTEETTKSCRLLLRDISMTGMGILSLQRIDELAKIEICFKVNDSTIETLTASIIHARELQNGKGFHYGCEFDEPNETIGRYIETKQMEKGLQTGTN